MCLLPLYQRSCNHHHTHPCQPDCCFGSRLPLFLFQQTKGERWLKTTYKTIKNTCTVDSLGNTTMPVLLFLMSLFPGGADEFTSHTMIQGEKCLKLNTKAPTIIKVCFTSIQVHFLHPIGLVEISLQSQHKLVGQT